MAPSVSILPKETGHFHAVRFYKDADSLARLVAEFVTAGFSERLPALVIATPLHLSHIVSQLRAQSLDVDALQRAGDLVLLDADAVLAQFMVDGLPSASRFRDTLIPIIEKACEGRRDCVVRAYGEMVDVLWKAGQTTAALRLEILWNQLAQTHAFALLCGYSMGNFYKDATQREICDHHSHVLTEPGEPLYVN